MKLAACTICGMEFGGEPPESAFAEAGAWLAEEVWRDAGELCPCCLENRGMLAMMYCHDLNT
jgi:hypothetical protein